MPELDDIRIKIKAQSDNASQDISSLAESIKESGNSVGAAVSNYTKLYNTLKQLCSATSEIDVLSNAISRLQSTFDSSSFSKFTNDFSESVTEISEALQNLNDIEATAIAKAEKIVTAPKVQTKDVSWVDYELPEFNSDDYISMDSTEREIDVIEQLLSNFPKYFEDAYDEAVAIADKLSNLPKPILQAVQKTANLRSNFKDTSKEVGKTKISIEDVNNLLDNFSNQQILDESQIESAANALADLNSVQRSNIFALAKLKAESSRTSGFTDLSETAKEAAIAFSKLPKEVQNSVINVAKLQKGFSSANGSLEEFISELNKVSGAENISEEAINSLGITLGNLAGKEKTAIVAYAKFESKLSSSQALKNSSLQISELAQGFAKLPTDIQKSVIAAMKLASTSDVAKKSLAEILQILNEVSGSSFVTKQQIESLGIALGGLTGEEQKAVLNNIKFENSMNKVAENASKASKEVEKVGKSAKSAGKGAKHAASGFEKLRKNIGKIVFYRAIRVIMSEITRAFKEGLQNVVLYSKAMNGLDSASANVNMSKLASSVLQLRNTLGALAAQILASSTPALITLMKAFDKVLNVMNQFFAALRGQTTYTKAVETNIDYAESLDKATDSAKKLKKSVMGFDELNVLQGQDTSSTATSTQPDASTMFEEVKIDTKIIEFADKVGAKLKWIKENFDTILKVALLIGAAIGLWKIASGVMKFFTFLTGADWAGTGRGIGDTAKGLGEIVKAGLGMAAAGVGILLTAGGIWLLADAAIKLSEKGWEAVAIMGGISLIGGALLFLLAQLAPMLAPAAVGLLAIGASILLMSAGIWILSDAAIRLAEAGMPAVAVLGGILLAVGAFVTLLAVLGPALTAGALGFIAFGLAVALVGVGVALIGLGIKLVCEGFATLAKQLPVISEFGLKAAASILALALSIVALGLAFVTLGIGLTIAAVGIGLAGAALLVASVGMVAVTTASVPFSGALLLINKSLERTANAAEKMGIGFEKTGIAMKIVSETLLMFKQFISVVKGEAKKTGEIMLELGKAFSDTGNKTFKLAQMLKILVEVLKICASETNKYFTLLSLDVSATLSGISGSVDEMADSIYYIFSSMFSGLQSVARSNINSIIDMINQLIKGTNNASNGIASWANGMGGTGKNILTPTIPKLAKGGYVGANSPVLAMIGDNTREGEIVAPESKISQAVEVGMDGFVDKITEAIIEGFMYVSKSDTDDDKVINVYIGGKKFDSAVINAGKIQKARSGGI